MNTLKTTLLLGTLSGLLLLVGESLGGSRGLEFALLLSVVMNLVSYFFSDRIALSLYAAQPVTPGENASVYARLAPLVATLCERMALPMPKLYLLPDRALNAFATGRNPEHASVAVTHGLLDSLDDEELSGVLAHELGHVKHLDILTASIAATLAAALTTLARMAFWFGGSRDRERGGGLAMLFVAPIAALLIQMGISRTREYAADEAAARYTGGPHGLIRALRKLDLASKRLPLEAEPATAHLFIVAPFTGGSLLSLFSTHPPVERRIQALEALR